MPTSAQCRRRHPTFRLGTCALCLHHHKANRRPQWAGLRHAAKHRTTARQGLRFDQWCRTAGALGAVAVRFIVQACLIEGEGSEGAQMTVQTTAIRGGVHDDVERVERVQRWWAVQRARYRHSSPSIQNAMGCFGHPLSSMSCSSYLPHSNAASMSCALEGERPHAQRVICADPFVDERLDVRHVVGLHRLERVPLRTVDVQDVLVTCGCAVGTTIAPKAAVEPAYTRSNAGP